MKKQSGFTLIELVIVIIILGILAVTAAPKFLNLQDDARNATLKGVEGALNSAAAMVYSKAVIAGEDKNATGSVKLPEGTVAIVYGYPAATSAALNEVLNLGSTGWTFGKASNGLISIYPNGVSASSETDKCFVTYAQPTASGKAPDVTVVECE